ncbi:glycoside hydrolase family 97 protein [Filimonas effusa]|nr:glycoside hydrolase family 97 protein [Filimonas effusa]
MAEEIVMNSPGKKLKAVVSVENGKLFYKLHTGTQTLLAPSPLGMKVNGATLGEQVASIVLSASGGLNVQNKGTRFVVAVTEHNSNYNIEFHIYDNGLAFRYLAPAIVNAHITEETTGFVPAGNPAVWFFERNNKWKLQSYAGLWMQTTLQQLDKVSVQGPVQGKPLLFVYPSGQYLLLSEAALYNYSGMRLLAHKGKLQVNFTEGDKGFDVNGPLVSPWRVLLFAEDLNSLVNNHLIEQLNPAPDTTLFADQSYIVPGKAVWSWITKDASYMQPASEMKMIDAAALLHFNYSLLDEGWETAWPQKWQQLKALVLYAAGKNVKLWVWKHSNELRDSIVREAFLDSLAMAGVAGVKTDFMNSEAMPLIAFEEALLRAAARRKLMVNFHGCQAPTGESRTYPNELTREGIRGMELNIMNEPIPAWHNAALPFTRFICGHGDYTPGFFSNKGSTTDTHQLALLYLFNSPFQCMAENPLTLLNNPAYAPVLPLLRSLPVTWDETIVLPGSSIGRLAAFARRKGDDWYVAAINGTDSAVAFNLNPGFLKAGTKYQAVVVSDNVKGLKKSSLNSVFTVNNITIQPSRVQSFVLPPAGGLVIAVKRN